MFKEGKIHCLYTGATDGIGACAVKKIISERKVTSILVHYRNEEKLAKLLEEVKKQTQLVEQQAEEKKDEAFLARPPVKVQTVKGDFSSLVSLSDMADDVVSTFPNLNLLISNAGVYDHEYKSTKDGYPSTFGINHCGTFLLTNKLLPLLYKNKPARIVTLSSLAHENFGRSTPNAEGVRTGTLRTTIDFKELAGTKPENFDHYLAYTGSKLANAMMARDLAERLKKSGESEIVSIFVHPGVVDTPLLQNLLEGAGSGLSSLKGVPVEKGIISTMAAAFSPEFGKAENSGKYLWEDGTVRAYNPLCDNEEQRVKLWNDTCDSLEEKGMYNAVNFKNHIQ